ncbi:MAG: DNA-binding response regulator [Chloroflexi bacterium]|nr:MAG: DNA-binding response regulator [Chloroflexota bacterium]RLC96859.1 MAG: DNA-binding response regulator [Chloroflexota bacterium]
MTKIRVLLVDDHKIMRQGMRHLLELDEGIEVVGEAETGEDALAEADLKRPDVVLMDIRIPGMDGIEATRQLKRAYPDMDVVMLTSYADDYVPEAIEAGASGYLLKSVDYGELSRAIRAVRAGEAIIDRSLGRELFRRFADLSRASKEADLSGRERDILRLLASGLNAKEIAGQIFVSHATVKRDLRQIMRKLNVESRTHAIAEAHRRKLI